VIAAGMVISVANAFPQPAFAANVDRASVPNVQKDPSSLAREFRLDLERVAIRAKGKHKQLIPVPQVGRDPGTTDISADVQRFIRVGASFDSAEALLIAAGFRIADSRRVNENAPESVPDRYVTSALLDLTLPDGSVAHLSVYLNPKRPADFREIGRVSALVQKILP
jgi:hypothetical protein